MIAKKNLTVPVILITLLLFYNCKENSKKNTSSVKNSTQLVDAGSDMLDPNVKWQLILNAQLDSLYTFYSPKAYKISYKGEMVNGAMRIMDLFKGKGLVINEISATERITAVLDSTVIYEIGNFSTPDRSSYAHLLIWRKEGKEIKRELELIGARVPYTPVPSELEQRRQEWMALCNTHNVSELVNELYTENTLYYNHKPMVVGREAVIAEYGYMGKSDYTLKLDPLIVEAVNKNLVFEIGKCSGSYRGNYVLVWKKGEDDIWRILLDSNI